LFLTLLITGCQQGERKTTDSGQDSRSNLILLPPPTPLAMLEKNTLASACLAWYDSVLGNGVFNGGMLVAKGGNIVFERYKGYEPFDKKDIVNANTSFHIASVSKTFTAMAVLTLKEEGKLQLNDLFSKYFPAFDFPGVTIQTLLNHRSGIPNYQYFMEKLNWPDTLMMRNQDVLDYLILHKTSIEDIGIADQHFRYSNTNYVLLALLIEKITGTSYPSYLQETFFGPLQMQHSFVYTRADSARASLNYDWRGVTIKNNYMDEVYGDKNIYSTPRDLLIWHRALSSNLLFTEATLQEAYAPYSNEKPGVKNYGLGWRMNSYPNGKKVIFHNGWWHGNNASFIRLQDEDATIIVLGNRFTYKVYKAYQLVNSFGDYFTVSEDVE
jgi:CubicO group peptidase (beta-lactamase class C family)